MVQDCYHIFFVNSLFGDSEEEKKKEAKGASSFTVPQNETINIFSLASGHLYERFLRFVLFVKLLIIEII